MLAKSFAIRYAKSRDGIGENYGPFNGLSRFYLPMMPMLTGPAKLSAMGPRTSVIDPSIQPTGYAAFCISYEFAH